MSAEVVGSRIEGSGQWSPARWYLLVTGIVHVLLGIAGLVVGRTFPLRAGEAQSAASDHVFGVFETNGWHSLAALGVAALALYFTLNPHNARMGALALGTFHVGIVTSLIIWAPSTFLLASNSADQVIHASTAVGGLVSGLLTPAPRAVGQDVYRATS